MIKHSKNILGAILRHGIWITQSGLFIQNNLYLFGLHWMMQQLKMVVFIFCLNLINWQNMTMMYA